ncbi:hypothetical protein T439DRAFT_326045 [Meredithblackwellia eburnea MCA 4105]
MATTTHPPYSVSATRTATLGSSNVPGWSIDGVSYSTLTPTQGGSSGGGNGVNKTGVGVGAGLGSLVLLAIASFVFVLYHRRKTRREFQRRTRAMVSMRSAYKNFAPDV